MSNLSKLNELILSIFIIVTGVSFALSLSYFAAKGLHRECAVYELKEVPVYISGVGHVYVKRDVCSYYKQPKKGN